MSARTLERSGSATARDDDERALEDPAFAGLADALGPCRAITVLRYRRRKRLTLRVERDDGQAEILKYLVTGVALAHDNQCRLAAGAHALGFTVSTPLWRDPGGRLLAQTLCDGRPFDIERDATDTGLAAAMGRAIASLHGSGIRFRDTFTMDDQQARSLRHVARLRHRSSALAAGAAALCARAETLRRAIEADDPATAMPIHGSLHVQQWLVDDDGLALVDFDRACMGDPELDAATLVADLEHEPEALALPMIRAFLAGLGDVDRRRFDYYRVHKHLAKVCKGACGTDAQALQKASRRLDRAWTLLERAGEGMP